MGSPTVGNGASDRNVIANHRGWSTQHPATGAFLKYVVMSGVLQENPGSVSRPNSDRSCPVSTPIPASDSAGQASYHNAGTGARRASMLRPISPVITRPKLFFDVILEGPRDMEGASGVRDVLRQGMDRDREPFGARRRDLASRSRSRARRRVSLRDRSTVTPSTKSAPASPSRSRRRATRRR